MHRVGNLWQQIVSDGNIEEAVRMVNKSHHWRSHHSPNKCTAWVEETLEDRKQDLRRVLEAGFIQQQPRVTKRYDSNAKKWRVVSEPIQWPDQYVHHALIRVLEPIMMRGMDKYCSGSIKGRGTHYAKKAIQRWMKKDRKGTKYCMTLDIRHFYQSLRPEVVMDRMRQIFKDANVLDLIWRTVKGGVLIGSYTSQWFANTTLQPLDHLIREGGYGVAHYLRYMDNFTIFGPNKRKLRKLRLTIEKWLNDHGMELKGDWQIFPTASRMPSAVGYRYGRSYTIPRKHNLLRIKRAVARFRKRRAQRRRILAGAAAGLISRLGMLRHCNNFHLYQLIFRGERLEKQLKNIIRAKSRKERLTTWNMYLEQRAKSKSSRSRALVALT